MCLHVVVMVHPGTEGVGEGWGEYGVGGMLHYFGGSRVLGGPYDIVSLYS